MATPATDKSKGKWWGGGGKKDPVPVAKDSKVGAPPTGAPAATGAPGAEGDKQQGDLQARFEAFMEEKCFKPEAREKMRMLPDTMKWHLLLQDKQSSTATDKKKEDDPQYWVDLLKSEHETDENLKSLQIVIKGQGKSWMKTFSDGGGLSNLLAVVAFDEGKKRKPNVEALRCVKAFMNNEYGLNVILNTSDAIDQICSALQHTIEDIRIEAFDILTVVSWVSAKGHTAVIQALQAPRFKIPRFKFLLDMLTRSKNYQLKNRVLTLINALINATDALEERVVTRRIFLDLGINNLVEGLQVLIEENKDAKERETMGVLQAQCDLFLEEYTNDQRETLYGGVDMGDIDGVFNYVKKVTAEDGNSGHLLKILTSFLAVPTKRDGDAFWSRLEQIVAEIVTNVTESPEGGVVPLKYEQIKQLMQKREDDEGTETPAPGGAKDDTLRKELHQLKMQNANLQDQLKAAKTGGGGGGGGGGGSEEVQRLREEIDKLKSQLASGGGGPPPDAPPMDGVPDAPIPDAPSDDAPPAPPMDGDGPPMAPPMDDDGAPPAPPMDGDGPPAAPAMDNTPKLPPKKTRKPKTKMKAFHWAIIQPREVGDTCWKTLNDDPIFDKLDVKQMEDLFGAASKAPGAEKSPAKAETKTKKKEVVELIESKRAYNVNIALARFRMSHEEIRDALLSMDEKTMTEEKLSALLKCAPTQDEIDTVTAFEDPSLLGPTEQFFLHISAVPRVEKRLNVFLFKLRFGTILSETEGMIAVCEQANKALRESKHLGKVLEIVLAIGNYMNGGTPKGGAYGFKLETLFKLSNTKSGDGLTLFHFLVKTIQEKFPQVKEIKNELRMLPDAARVESSFLKQEVNKISGQLRLAAGEVKSLPASQNDRFLPVMKEFLDDAEKKGADLTQRLEAVEKGGVELIKYYGEDPDRKKLEDIYVLFNDFLSEFVKAEEYLEKKRIAEERENARQVKLAAAKAKSEAEDAKHEEDPPQETPTSEEKAEGGQVDATLKTLGTNDAGDIMKAIRARRKGKAKPAAPVPPKKPAEPAAPTMPTLRPTGLGSPAPRTSISASPPATPVGRPPPAGMRNSLTPSIPTPSPSGPAVGRFFGTGGPGGPASSPGPVPPAFPRKSSQIAAPPVPSSTPKRGPPPGPPPGASSPGVPALPPRPSRTGQ